MKIGMIVYSYTGQTLALAEALQEKLTAAGHEVQLKQLETPAGFKPGQSSTTLSSIPSLGTYDDLVLAAPTWGGLPASPMAAFLEKLPDLQGKRLVYLATGFFPPKLGCLQAIEKMKTACEAKHAQSLGSGSISRLCFGRKKKTEQMVKELAGLF